MVSWLFPLNKLSVLVWRSQKENPRQEFGCKLLIWELVSVDPTPVGEWEFETGRRGRPEENVLVISWPCWASGAQSWMRLVGEDVDCRTYFKVLTPGRGRSSNIYPGTPLPEVCFWGINSTELSSCLAHTLNILRGQDKAVRETVKDACSKKLLGWVQGDSGC